MAVSDFMYTYYDIRRLFLVSAVYCNNNRFFRCNNVFGCNVHILSYISVLLPKEGCTLIVLMESFLNFVFTRSTQLILWIQINLMA